MPRFNTLGLPSVDLAYPTRSPDVTNAITHLREGSLYNRKLASYAPDFTVPGSFAVLVCSLNIEQLAEAGAEEVLIGLRRGGSVRMGTTSIENLGTYTSRGINYPAIAAKLGMVPLWAFVDYLGRNNRLDRPLGPLTTRGLRISGSRYAWGREHGLTGIALAGMRQLEIPVIANM